MNRLHYAGTGLHDKLCVVVAVAWTDGQFTVLEESVHCLICIARHVDTIAFRPDFDADQNHVDVQLTIHLLSHESNRLNGHFPPTFSPGSYPDTLCLRGNCKRWEGSWGLGVVLPAESMGSGAWGKLSRSFKLFVA